MLKLKLVFQNKKGFTLIELILGIAIMSMLIMTLYTCLSFTLKLSEKSIVEDEILLNGRYISEYIKEEISSADKIITSSYFNDLDNKFPRNIGFVILEIDRMKYNRKNFSDEKNINYNTNEYSYTTYYFQDDTIIRINAKRNIKKEIIISLEKNVLNFPSASEFNGYNKIGDDISSKSKIFLKEDNTISLDLFFEKEKTELSNFKSDLFVRCKVVK